jgi:signal transduction histidine kinase/phage shock protein PspC (stress-responsive transcriptional regulator)
MADAPAVRPRVPARLPLRRPERGRWIGGVALGLAAHLDWPVRLVRLLFVASTLLFGVGAVLYGFLWLTVPVGDPVDAAGATRPAVLGRLTRRQADEGRPLRLPGTEVVVGVLLLAGAAVLLVVRARGAANLGWVLPVFVLVAGLVLAWSQLGVVARGRARAPEGGRLQTTLRIAGGLLLAGVGVLLLVLEVSGHGVEPAVLGQAVIAAVAVLVGVALVLAPWWLRLARELGDERAARAREAERADIAAHLHDSVLQTLAIIRARADEPTEVARMARAQERELREWLYQDRHAPGTSVAAALRAVVAEVEDTRTAPDGEPVAVDVVVVGDRAPDDGTQALLAATREALVNAVTHGRAPVSLYLEAGDEQVEVFVRDHGDGFDIDAIPADRFGVRESILGRVRRRGGTASVTCRPGRGTEVHLVVPVGPCPADDETTAPAAAANGAGVPAGPASNGSSSAVGLVARSTPAQPAKSSRAGKKPAQEQKEKAP